MFFYVSLCFFILNIVVLEITNNVIVMIQLLNQNCYNSDQRYTPVLNCAHITCTLGDHITRNADINFKMW
jgi:hypothetical protein